ncbi:MAG TPA: hypothetical protein VFX97_07220 [Pyrinomonadaceae bacterium]|nr:hypothetical protein [Pyrinomonadaceae bacterium]
MKKRSSKHNVANRRRRLLFVVVVAVILVATAITVISRQKGRATQAASRDPNKVAAPAFVTRRVGSQDIHINTQTGEMKPLTQDEAQRLANDLAPMLDTSTDGLTQVRHADGSVSMDLQGRFQNVTVARISADGAIEQSCVDNPRAAAKFFRIDPKLIENAPTARQRTRN